MTKQLLLILALSGMAFGQTTFQECSDNADAVRVACLAADQKTFDASKATDLAHYNDCINPNSSSSTGLAGCYRTCAPSDYPCFNNCYIEFLGDGTSANLGICKNVQLDEDAAAGNYLNTQDAACWADWRMRMERWTAVIVRGAVRDPPGGAPTGLQTGDELVYSEH